MDNTKETISNEVEDYKIDIQEDGSVLVTQKIKFVYKQKYRDFLTEYRQLIKNKENAEKYLTDEYQDKIKKDIKAMEEDIKDLKDYVDKSEKKFYDYNRQKQKESQLKILREELSKSEKERNNNYLKSIWENINKNTENGILKELTEEEKQELKKASLKAKRKAKR
jgi:hypothetical protein